MTDPVVDPAPVPADDLARRNKRTAMIAGGVVAGMLGLAFASDPLYDVFCEVTGFGGTTRIAEAAPSAVLEREIEVRFDANIGRDVPLEFTPQQISTRLRIGETGLAFYTVRNLSDQPFTTIASYNVTPHQGGPFFMKLECFCFQNRTLQPGEVMELPVVFYVDPELVDDPNAAQIQTITLSYTFWEAAPEFGSAPTTTAAAGTAGVQARGG
jgi:cytochrome c oxidase assembly protein subunit 11